MQSVTLTRTIDAQPGTVADAMDDLEPFMLAAGFDEVDVDGDAMHVANLVGIAEIELVLELVDEPGAALAYEQREGIFEEMVTSYAIEPVDASDEVVAADDGADGVDVETDAVDGDTDAPDDDTEADPSGTEVTATTEFAMDVPLVGGILDATVIKRQRRTELAAQLDWLEANCSPTGP
ncbi:hypothetical protein GCM10028857_14910 [Salinarchaeum chitinilyticum]